MTDQPAHKSQKVDRSIDNQTISVSMTDQTQTKTSGDLVSKCCNADFNPLGFDRGDGTWDEKCLKCGKLCDVYWKEDQPKTIQEMVNKEKESFLGKWKGELYREVKNLNYIKDRNDKWSWVTCDEDVWTDVEQSMLSLVEKMLEDLKSEIYKTENPFIGEVLEKQHYAAETMKGLIAGKIYDIQSQIKKLAL